jgi:hypothetical protein
MNPGARSQEPEKNGIISSGCSGFRLLIHRQIGCQMMIKRLMPELLERILTVKVLSAKKTADSYPGY